MHTERALESTPVSGVVSQNHSKQGRPGIAMRSNQLLAARPPEQIDAGAVLPGASSVEGVDSGVGSKNWIDDPMMDAAHRGSQPTGNDGPAGNVVQRKKTPTPPTAADSEQWAERTHSLAGKWVRVITTTTDIEPVSAGPWANGKRTIAKDTVLFVAGMKASDGAILVNMPRAEGGGYEQVWLHHYVVEPTATPVEKVEKLPDTGDGQADTEKRKEAVENLGDVDAFDGGFYSAAGSVLDALVPDAGDKGKVQINVNIPVAVGGNVKIALQFVGTAERSATGVKAGIELGGGIIGEVDLLLFEAWAKAMVYGYMEANGDDGAEVFRLLSYAMHERVRAVSEKAAHWVWGEQFGAKVKAEMDDDDYVESGLGAEFSMGAGNSAGTKGGYGSARYAEGTKLTKDGSEELEKINLKAGFAYSPWAGEFEYKGTSPTMLTAIHKQINAMVDPNKSPVTEHEINLAGTRSVDVLQFTSALENNLLSEQLIDWVGGCIGNVSGLITGGTGLKGEDARLASSAFQLVKSSSLTMNIGSNAALIGLNQKFKTLNAAEMGQKLSIVIKWKNDYSKGTCRSCTAEVRLERLSNIEVGKNDRAAVYVLVENIQKIFSTGEVAII